jgi:protein tyrosine phosphatase domain-containing protein 1
MLYSINIVYSYNYGWVDYGVPTLKSVLDMVKVVDFAVGEGKVAIHCHAGLGRTGVLIASYLIYSKRMGGNEAIALVREKR